MQAENYVLRLNAEAYEEELVRRQALPANWTPMDDALNTQLFEVDSASPEVASLVQSLQSTGATVVKVSPCWWKRRKEKKRKRKKRLRLLASI